MISRRIFKYIEFNLFTVLELTGTLLYFAKPNQTKRKYVKKSI